MLSKLFKSLRNNLPVILPSNPPDPEPDTSLTTSTMVTTRNSANKAGLSPGRGAVTPSVDETPAELVSPKKGKRRRVQKAEGGKNSNESGQSGATPSAVTKRQKLPVRNKNEKFVKHSHISVVIHTREINTAEQAPSSWGEAEAEKASKPEFESLEQGDDYQTATEESATISEDSALKSGTEEVEGAFVVSLSSASSKGSGRDNVATEFKTGQELDTEDVQDNKPINASTRKHKRFDSEEPLSEMIIEESKHVEYADESSDDDAPEVVAIHDAEESIKVAARGISKAAEQQTATLRRKRRERDAQLKEQAVVASKKRKHKEDSEDELSPPPSKITSTLQEANMSRNRIEEHLDVPASNKDGDISNSETRKENVPVPEGNMRRNTNIAIHKSNLPEFLPADYLDDSMDIDGVHLEAQLEIAKRPKKIKFPDLVEKKPRDITKGNTTYRVTEGRGIYARLLAPPAARNARSTKEAWMQGRFNIRGGVGTGGSRKVMNAGFFTRR